MKQAILFILFFTVVTNLESQTITRTIDKMSMNPGSTTVVCEESNNNTYIAIIFAHSNAYSQLDVSGSIFFHSRAQAQKFLDGCQYIIDNWSKINANTELDYKGDGWQVKGYIIMGMKGIRIYDTSKDSYDRYINVMKGHTNKITKFIENNIPHLAE